MYHTVILVVNPHAYTFQQMCRRPENSDCTWNVWRPLDHSFSKRFQSSILVNWFSRNSGLNTIINIGTAVKEWRCESSRYWGSHNVQVKTPVECLVNIHVPNTVSFGIEWHDDKLMPHCKWLWQIPMFFFLRYLHSGTDDSHRKPLDRHSYLIRDDLKEFKISFYPPLTFTITFCVQWLKQSRYKTPLYKKGLAPTRYARWPALRHRTGLKLHHNRFVSSTKADTTWCNLNHNTETDERPITICIQSSLIICVGIRLRMTISVTNFCFQFPSIWHSHLWIARMAFNIQRHTTPVQGGNKNFHTENGGVWEFITKRTTDRRRQLGVSGRSHSYPCAIHLQQDKQNTYNATVTCVHATILVVEKH
jgi:hypothetical protein